MTTQKYSPKKHFQKFSTQLCSSSFLSDRRFGKNIYINNNKTTNKFHYITLTIEREIQKSSTLLHSTSQHTKKVKTFPFAATKPKIRILRRKNKTLSKYTNKTLIESLKNKTPKTNQLVICNALNFDIIRKHVLLPIFLLFFPLPFVVAITTTQ